MTETEVGLLVAVLARAFPSFRCDPETVATWSLVLAGDDAAAVQRSALRFARGEVPGQSTAFVPSTADLLADVATCRRMDAAEQDELAREGRLALTAGSDAAADERAERDHRAWEESGYSDRAAFIRDRFAGAVAERSDAAHRRWSHLLGRVYDERTEWPIDRRPSESAAPVLRAPEACSARGELTGPQLLPVTTPARTRTA
jgi:hypothetical protein